MAAEPATVDRALDRRDRRQSGRTVPFADQQAQRPRRLGAGLFRVLRERDSADASAAGGPGLDFDHDFAAEFLGRGYGFIGGGSGSTAGILNPFPARISLP